MAVGEIVVSFSADTGAFETDTKRASDALIKAEKLVKQLNKAMADSHQASTDFIGPLQPQKMRPAIEGVERLNSAVQKSQAGFRASNQVVQQASYQITDFVVQVSGGVSAMRAFSQQAPQLLGAFGGAGAALGLVAALGGAVGDLIMKMSGAKSLEESFKQLDDVLGQVSNTAQTFDMKNMIEQFNAADANVRRGILSLIEYRKVAAELASEEAAKSLQSQLKDVVSPGALKRMLGDFSPSELGLKPDVAADFFAEVRSGTSEASILAQKYSTSLAQGNEKARELAATLNKAALAQQSAANAASAMSKFAQQAGIAGTTGMIPVPGGRSSRAGVSAADRLAKQELASADKFIDALQRQTDQLAFNKNLIGMTTQEVELLNAQYNVQAELTKTIQDMERQGITISTANMEAMKTAATQAIEAQTAIITASQERQRTSIFGMQESIRQYTDSASNMAKNMQGAFTNAFKGMEDGLVQFALTGKLSFADFANAVLSDIMRIQIRMMMAGLIQNVASSYFGNTSSVPTDGTRLETGGAMSNGFAEGGYTGEGSKYQPAGIVHAGEFVMSQQATKRIGVGTLNRMLKGYAAGGYVGATPTGTSGGDVSIVVNNNSSNAQATAKSSTDSFGNRQIEIMVADMVNKAISTGKTDSAMRSSYNIRRSGK